MWRTPREIEPLCTLSISLVSRDTRAWRDRAACVSKWFRGRDVEGGPPRRGASHLARFAHALCILRIPTMLARASSYYLWAIHAASLLARSSCPPRLSSSRGTRIVTGQLIMQAAMRAKNWERWEEGLCARVEKKRIAVTGPTRQISHALLKKRENSIYIALYIYLPFIYRSQ